MPTGCPKYGEVENLETSSCLSRLSSIPAPPPHTVATRQGSNHPQHLYACTQRACRRDVDFRKLGPRLGRNSMEGLRKKPFVRPKVCVCEKEKEKKRLASGVVNTSSTCKRYVSSRQAERKRKETSTSMLDAISDLVQTHQVCGAIAFVGSVLSLRRRHPQQLRGLIRGRALGAQARRTSARTLALKVKYEYTAGVRQERVECQWQGNNKSGVN